MPYGVWSITGWSVTPEASTLSTRLASIPRMKSVRRPRRARVSRRLASGLPPGRLRRVRTRLWTRGRGRAFDSVDDPDDDRPQRPGRGADDLAGARSLVQYEHG